MISKDDIQGNVSHCPCNFYSTPDMPRILTTQKLHIRDAYQRQPIHLLYPGIHGNVLKKVSLVAKTMVQNESI
jgi:hypothetical protein